MDDGDLFCIKTIQCLHLLFSVIHKDNTVYNPGISCCSISILGTLVALIIRSYDVFSVQHVQYVFIDCATELMLDQFLVSHQFSSMVPPDCIVVIGCTCTGKCRN